MFKIYENENLEWKQLQSILNFPFSSERVPLYWSIHFYFIFSKDLFYKQFMSEHYSNQPVQIKNDFSHISNFEKLCKTLYEVLISLI